MACAHAHTHMLERTAMRQIISCARLSDTQEQAPTQVCDV